MDPHEKTDEINETADTVKAETGTAELELPEEDFEKERSDAEKPSEEIVESEAQEDRNSEAAEEAVEENIEQSTEESAEESEETPVEEGKTPEEPESRLSEPKKGEWGSAQLEEKEEDKEKSESVSESEPEEKQKKSKNKLLAWAISVSMLIILVLGGIIGIGIYASNLNTILPNVVVEGEDLSNLTYEQALEQLDKAGRNKNQKDSKITILLPLKRKISVYAHRVDANINSEKIADTAFAYGHSGNIFKDSFSYIRSFFGVVSLQVDLSPDRDKIEKIVGEKIDNLIAVLTGSGIEIKEDSIYLVKGAKNVEVDKEAIIEEVERRLKNREYGDFRYEPKVEGEVEFDENALHESIYAEVREARYDKETHEIVSEVVGCDFDKAEARRLWDKAEFGSTIVVPLTVTTPELTAKDIEGMLYRDVLGESTTSFAGSSANRINNIGLACKALDGKILQPGETFSYNDTVGPRTPDRGYKLAPIYSSGEVVQGFGGGICQVSSSLYTCVLYADLQVDERENHYFRVGYLPPAQDATVSWGYPDLKFTNNTDYPIRISAEVNTKSNKATLKIYGTNVDGGYIELVYTTWLVYKNPEYPEVATGMGALLYKKYFDRDGNLINTVKDSRSEYHFHPEDIKYPEPTPTPPPATPEPTPPPAPEPEPPTP